MILSGTIGAEYGGAGGASAPPALSDGSAGGARWCNVHLDLAPPLGAPLALLATGQKFAPMSGTLYMYIYIT